ncbi:MAG: DNA helicase RecQ [Legionellaceae bacterium]
MNVIEHPITPTRAPLTVLKHYYGFDNFRAPQAEIVQDVIEGQDVLVLMPTGGGKSLCYQIPALIRPGVAIIVSPLIALMEDQVAALTSLGISAAYYNSSLSAEASRNVLSALHNNTLDLLYIAPERLLTEGFIDRLKTCNISLFAIDEAHCISQWGHDFRKEYSSLGQLKTHFPKIPLIALTATADSQTQKDIIQQLNYTPKQYIASFNRPNIHYTVHPKLNPFKQLTLFLDKKIDQAGIVYCGTRSTVERLTLKLQEKGYRAAAYHAGLSFDERKEAQTRFRYDHIDVVVATVAFGMGIDKPNVRFVIHYDLPKNIESYYQETGRAGRDGLPAEALLLYDPADSARLRSFVAAGTSETQQRIEHNKLNHMLAFAEASDCRRRIILRYFDEYTDTPCGYCDRCDHPPETIDATVDAQKFLSCIYRLKERYGMMHVIDVLKGSLSDKIKRAGHDRLSTFGIGKEHSIAYWKHLGWQLMYKNYCKQDIDQYNVLRLTQDALAVLRKETTVLISLPSSPLKPDSSRPPKDKTKRAALIKTESPLVTALRSLRRKLADEESKPPFMIFSDMTLYEIVRLDPHTLDDLLNVPGIGQHKLTYYGNIILETMRNHRTQASYESTT